ncbi:MAG: DUF2333 family protein [Rhizomicrobium sp.]
MEWGQALRAWWRGIRARFADARARARSAGETVVDAGSDILSAPRIGRGARIALGLAIILVVFYPLAAWYYSTIDDNPDFGPRSDMGQPHESQTVAATIALIDREVNQHGWAASAPFYEPPALLDNMPNYQEGIVSALATVAVALRDRMGHGADTPDGDSDLGIAAGFLQYPPDVWFWNPRRSLWPREPSDDQYLRAMAALASYNDRLAGGDAHFDASAENLQAILERVSDDLGASSATIEYHVDRASGSPFEVRSDDIFYKTKGRMYGYYVVLKGLQIDFQGTIRARHLAATWGSMMASLRAAIAMRPSIVLDGSPDSDFIPCTLCGEGFYVLRVRSELQAIAKGLQQK